MAVSAAAPSTLRKRLCLLIGNKIHFTWLVPPASLITKPPTPVLSVPAVFLDEVFGVVIKPPFFTADMN